MKKSTIKLLLTIFGGLLFFYIAVSLLMMLINMVIPLLVFIGLGYVAYIIMKVAVGGSETTESSELYQEGELFDSLETTTETESSRNLSEEEIYEKYVNGEIDENEMELLLEQTLSEEEDVLQETN